MDKDIETLDFIFNVELDEFINKVTLDLELKANIKKIQKNICHPQNPIYGSKFIATLTESELVKLIKVMTLFDSLSGLGSVSPVSFLLNEYRLRDPDNYESLLEWVFIENDGRNPWLATGSALYGVRSIKELEEYQRIKMANAGAGQRDAEKRHLEKRDRLRIKANNDIWNAIRRKDLKAIKVLLERGVDLDAKNSDGKTVKEMLDQIRA